MERHNLVVIGASAGGISVLQQMLHELPASLDAAILIVLHRSSDVLQAILQRSSRLPVVVAHVEPLVFGRVYIAEPDRHLIVEPGRVRSVYGPKENWFRPSVNVLFRSAAHAYGPRVIGVVLTGILDDGAVGLEAIKSRGGVALVQDPADAQFSMMPEAALRRIVPDAVLPLRDMASAIMDEIRKEALPADDYPVTEELTLEVQIAKQELTNRQLLEAVERLGTRSIFTCPECHGTLWEIHGEDLRFRCHVGHAYSAEALTSGQASHIEEALWSALRALEEKAQLIHRLSERSRERRADRSADAFERQAREIDERVGTLRAFITSLPQEEA